jgi:ribonucleotide reductase beta subunit family protein with ferritin-like domain
MPGLANANVLISRDENSHCEFAALLFSKLIHKPSEKIIRNIILSAVELEKQFVCGAVKTPLLGLNSDLLCLWVEYMADHVASMFKIAPLFNTPNPLPWMNSISMSLKSNFHEGRVPEYTHIQSSGFDLDASF